jgi:hypothetical protein
LYFFLLKFRLYNRKIWQKKMTIFKVHARNKRELHPGKCIKAWRIHR